MPVEKLGKGVLLFGNKETGEHIEGIVILKGRPGDVFWELLPLSKPKPENGPDHENEEEKKLKLEERRRLRQKERDTELAKTRPGQYL